MLAQKVGDSFTFDPALWKTKYLRPNPIPWRDSLQKRLSVPASSRRPENWNSCSQKSAT